MPKYKTRKIRAAMKRRNAAVKTVPRDKRMLMRWARKGTAKDYEKLRELANQRRRFGYRRLHILLRREGVMINRKKTQRLYQEEGLAVSRRRRHPPRVLGNGGLPDHVHAQCEGAGDC